VVIGTETSDTPNGRSCGSRGSQMPGASTTAHDKPVINSALIPGARKIGETRRARSARRIVGRREKCAALPQDVP